MLRLWYIQKPFRNTRFPQGHNRGSDHKDPVRRYPRLPSRYHQHDYKKELSLSSSLPTTSFPAKDVCVLKKSIDTVY